MAFRVNTEIFQNKEIREALETLSKVGGRRKLGIRRWDNVLDVYPFSGTVTLPVKIGYKIFKEPFYFVVEKINDKESLRIKPVEGEQWSIGDVYGFFGFHDFADYTYDFPILVVEGTSDWAVCKRYYKYTVASLSAWMSSRQVFILSAMSRNILVGYDSDATGTEHAQTMFELFRQRQCSLDIVHPSGTDWGAMFEDEFQRKILDSDMRAIQNRIAQITNNLV